MELSYLIIIKNICYYQNTFQLPMLTLRQVQFACKGLWKVFQPQENQPCKFTPKEALALFLDLGLSKEKYMALRSNLMKKTHNAL